MNAYADNLLTICLGWMKTVVRTVFNFFVSDQSHSFGAWLGDNWLSLVFMLCLAGTLIDFAVYLRRYKPYLLWGKKKPQVRQASHGADPARNDDGYTDGVVLDTTGMDPYGRQGGSYFDPAETADETYYSPFDDQARPSGTVYPMPPAEGPVSPYEPEPPVPGQASYDTQYPQAFADGSPYSDPPQHRQLPRRSRKRERRS